MYLIIYAEGVRVRDWKLLSRFNHFFFAAWGGNSCSTILRGGAAPERRGRCEEHIFDSRVFLFALFFYGIERPDSSLETFLREIIFTNLSHELCFVCGRISVQNTRFSSFSTAKIAFSAADAQEKWNSILPRCRFHDHNKPRAEQFAICGHTH